MDHSFCLFIDLLSFVCPLNIGSVLDALLLINQVLIIFCVRDYTPLFCISLVSMFFSFLPWYVGVLSVVWLHETLKECDEY